MRSPLKLAHSIYLPKHSNTVSEKISPILILHCILGCRKSWDSLAQKIANETDRKVYTLDVCNHGESPSTQQTSLIDMTLDVAHFLENKNISKCDLLGHSLGGRISMILALQRPSWVRTLTVVDVSPIQQPAQMPSYMNFIINTLREVQSQLPKGITLKDAKTHISHKLIEADVDPSFCSVLTDTVIQRGDSFHFMANLDIVESTFEPQMLRFPAMNTSAYLGPTYFIGAGKTTYIRLEDHVGIYKLFPKAEITYIPETSHLIPFHKPDLFFDTFIGFFKRYAYLPKGV